MNQYFHECYLPLLFPIWVTGGIAHSESNGSGHVANSDDWVDSESDMCHFQVKAFNCLSESQRAVFILWNGNQQCPKWLLHPLSLLWERWGQPLCQLITDMWPKQKITLCCSEPLRVRGCFVTTDNQAYSYWFSTCRRKGKRGSTDMGM